MSRCAAIAAALLSLQVLPKLGKSPLAFFVFWGIAFATLALALVIASVFSRIIESDFELSSLPKEAVLAALASAIEGGFAWLIAIYAPSGARGMLIPLVTVAVLYQVAHFDTWNRTDAVMVVGLQLALFIVGACFALGHFLLALLVAGLVGLFLGVFAFLAKSM